MFSDRTFSSGCFSCFLRPPNYVLHDQQVSTEQVLHWNLKPWEFLQDASIHRRKSHDPSRSVNLLGRLNRLFYQESFKLPSLKKIHDLIAQPLEY